MSTARGGVLDRTARRVQAPRYPNKDPLLAAYLAGKRVSLNIGAAAEHVRPRRWGIPSVPERAPTVALIRCPDCGRDVSDAAPACPHCGRPLANAGASAPRPAPGPAKAEPRKISTGAGCLLVVIVFALIGKCSEMFDEREKQQTAQTQSEARAAQAVTQRAKDSAWALSVAPQQAGMPLADAIRFDSVFRRVKLPVDGSVAHGRVMAAALDSAAFYLRPAKNRGPAPGQAEPYLARLWEPLTPAQKQRRDQLQAAVTRENARIHAEAQRLLRRQFAKEYESHLLDNNMNADVTVGGADATTLTVKWALVSKVLAHKLSQDPALFEKLRGMGFKKFVITDGYDDTWYWDL